MRSNAFYVAALAGLTAAKSIPQIRNVIRGLDELVITQEEVDLMDLYASYTASAPCNNGTAVGDLVTCYKNCDRVEADGAVVIGSYMGEETEFAAYMALVEKRKQIVWVGRGSATDKNWDTNLKTALVPSDLVEGAKIHTGFQTAWSEISEQVFATLEDAVAQHPDYDIVITGGSLGGAVATIAAAYIRKAGYQADLYTYGAPRIGNGALSDFITAQPGKLYRVTHNQDIVPRLPSPLPDPNFLFPDWPQYRHVSPEYWLQGEPADPDAWPTQDIKICEGNWNRDCISNPSNGWDWNLADPQNDHLNYMGSLMCWNSEDGAVELAIPSADTMALMAGSLDENSG